MPRPRHCAIEAHTTAATLYLSGDVAVPALLEAMRLADALPRGVWLLRVDIAAAAPLDAGTATVLAHLLRRWSERRTGLTQVVDGRSPADAAHTRFPPSRRLFLRALAVTRP